MAILMTGQVRSFTTQLMQAYWRRFLPQLQREAGQVTLFGVLSLKSTNKQGGNRQPHGEARFFRQRQGVQTGYIKLHPFGSKNFEDFLHEIVEVQLRSPERLCLLHERYNKKFNIVELCTWAFKSSRMYVGLLYFWDLNAPRQNFPNQNWTGFSTQ